MRITIREIKKIIRNQSAVKYILYILYFILLINNFIIYFFLSNNIL